jgi:iron complex transport system ATP-binding protein
LVGPNAAGKSTLLRALAGLMKSSGEIRLGGLDVNAMSATERAAAITYMPQSLPQRVALTVMEAVLSALRASPSQGDGDAAALRRRAVDALDRLAIGQLALRSLDELSGGQRQMASLAQAIVREPKVLLLDEPTSALDLHYQYRVMSRVRELARERGIITVVVLHDISLACRWADRIVVLSDGAIAAAGKPAEAITPDILARVYGVEARVETCSRGVPQVLVDSPIQP